MFVSNRKNALVVYLAHRNSSQNNVCIFAYIGVYHTYMKRIVSILYVILYTCLYILISFDTFSFIVDENNIILLSSNLHLWYKKYWITWNFEWIFYRFGLSIKTVSQGFPCMECQKCLWHNPRCNGWVIRICIPF